jgi:type I restriction enzyme S subunit
MSQAVVTVHEVREPSAKYLVQPQPERTSPLVQHFHLLATAPGGVASLRELVLTLAVQGKLVPQDPSDEPASELLKKIRFEKDRLIAEGKIKRDKPLAEIADEEKPFDLPKGWEWVRLAQLGLLGSSVRVHQKDWTSSGVPFYRAREIVSLSKNGHVYNELFITEKHFQDLALKGMCPEEGDIMITGVGTIGIPYVVKADDRFYFKDASVLIFKNLHGLNSQYLDLFFRVPYWIDRIHADSMGTTVHTLTIARAAEVLVPVPPRIEQCRIVTRVEELMRLCDALEAKGKLEAEQHARLVSTLLGTLTQSESPEALAENWQRVAAHFDLLLDRPEAVDALEQTILQLAVRGLLVPQDPSDEPASELLKKIRAEKDQLIAQGKIKRDKPLPPIAEDEKPFELPRGWEWVRVSDAVEMLNGYAFKSEWFKKTGIRLLRNLNISHGYVDWTHPAAIEANAANEFQSFALCKGDIVLSLDRPIISTGLKYAVIRDADLPCLLLQRVARLAPEKKLVSSDFLVLWLQSDLFVGTIDPGRSNGVPHISTKQVGGLTLALPPLSEQSRIVTRVNELRRLCADLRQRLSGQQKLQTQLAEALVAEVA